MNRTIVIAIGGNSLIQDPKHVTVPAQYHAVYETAQTMEPLLAEGNNVAIVHGNGPQVGFILRRAEIAKKYLHMVPLDSCVADTQGALGYNIQLALRNVLKQKGVSRPATTVVTQVLVDKNDPSFTNPSKPIGSFMGKKEAEQHQKKDGWSVFEDSGRGWRRVVPSPAPLEILEVDIIKNLVENGVITIAAGGGGIPVIQSEDGSLIGIEAVIDKDKAACLLAKQIHADRFIISTAVERVCLYYGTEKEQPIEHITVSKVEKLAAEGHFAPGSMLPKIEAIIDYVRSTRNPGSIVHPKHLGEDTDTSVGTHIMPD